MAFPVSLPDDGLIDVVTVPLVREICIFEGSVLNIIHSPQERTSLWGWLERARATVTGRQK